MNYVSILFNTNKCEERRLLPVWHRNILLSIILEKVGKIVAYVYLPIIGW